MLILLPLNCLLIWPNQIGSYTDVWLQHEMAGLVVERRKILSRDFDIRLVLKFVKCASVNRMWLRSSDLGFWYEMGLTGTGKAMVSKDSIIEKWVAAKDTFAAQDLTFPMEFAVLKGFGVPGAIIVKNKHPNEFLLVSFSVDVPNSGEAHYMTNSWVYNTGNTEGRIFFQNKVQYITPNVSTLQLP